MKCKIILTEEIEHIAENAMIDVIGFAHALPFSNYILKKSKRRDPKLTLSNAESIIVAGVYIGGLTLPEWTDPVFGRSSRLYLSGFFLDVIEPLKPIANHLLNSGYQAHICNGTLDGGSILPLKQAAVRAGIGWQGKHSLLISRQFGTFLALGGIITDAKLVCNDQEEPDRCGKCTECLKACPLNALSDPYQLNVERCLSNQLAEEDLSQDAIAIMENRIGDCEICQHACPWNKKHLATPLKTKMTPLLRERLEKMKPFFHLPNLIDLSEEEYHSIFGTLGTGIPYLIFKRNISIAFEKSGYDKQNQF